MNDVHVLAPRIDAKDYGLRCSLASHGSAKRNHAFRRTFSHRQRAPTMDELASRQYPVHEHMAFQRRMWIVQRIGWIAGRHFPGGAFRPLRLWRTEQADRDRCGNER